MQSQMSEKSFIVYLEFEYIVFVSLQNSFRRSNLQMTIGRKDLKMQTMQLIFDSSVATLAAIYSDLRELGQ